MSRAWRAAREESCAHGHADASEWQGLVGCQSWRQRATSCPAPRPGKLSSSRDGNTRPLWARTATRWTSEASATGEGAPRSTTRELATRNKVKSPSHFDASSVSPGACADQLVHGGKAATHEPSGGSSASAACPAAAQRCRSRRLTEPLRQLAPRYRRPLPILGHCRGRAERRARRCGAGSGFYSASGTISPIFGRS